MLDCGIAIEQKWREVSRFKLVAGLDNGEYYMRRKSIAFFTVHRIHIPHNLREYYLSYELIKKKWKVFWLLPFHGQNDALAVQWPIKRYHILDIRGHKFVFPVYLAIKLKLLSMDVIWISGWSQRDPEALFWFIRILKAFGIKIIYDPIDPIDIFNEAQEQGNEQKQNRTAELMASIYNFCDIIFCVTPEIRDLIIKKGVSDKKVFIGRWGTDISRFNRENVKLDYKIKLGLKKDTFLVGWLGSMNPFKGLKEIMLPLIHQLSQEIDDIHFVIAGYGLLEKDIKIWVRKNKKLPVTFLGRIPYDITPSFTMSLDVYLVPTNPGSEFARSICPVKCFDAIAMGTDVITTKTKATKFLEDIAENVHLCEFKVDSFRDTITNLYKNRNRQKQKSYPSAIFPFSHQGVSKQIAEIIQKNI